MKILFDHQIFNIQKYGGISRYFYELANHIAGMEGHEVEIFAPFFINKYFGSDSRVRPGGIKSPPLPGFQRFIDAINREGPRLLVKPRQDIDIFHETYYSMTDNCPLSAKRIITVYDMIHEKFPEHFPAFDETQKMKAHVVSHADHCICISENTRQDLISLLDVPEEKISVVHLGYSLSCRTNMSRWTEPGRPFILYVGSRDRYKNFPGFLRACSASSVLKNELSIICFGGGGFNAHELSLIESLNLTVRHVSGGDEILAGLYVAAAVFVYPSLYEGFGIPPLEAMAYNCPVVCSNSSALPEVVGDAAELFNPNDERDMCKAIERVVLSPERMATLVNKGQERIRNFSWQKCAEETLAVYQKILQG